MKHLTKALPSETVSNNTTGTDKSDWPSLDEDVPKLVQTESTRLHSQQVKAEDENTDAPTSVSIPDPPPALEPSSRRKSVKGSSQISNLISNLFTLIGIKKGSHFIFLLP